MGWSDELKVAIDLFNQGENARCIAFINRVLRDNTPNYLRIRYNAILARCIVDWREAEVGYMAFRMCPVPILTCLSYRQNATSQKAPT
jgi:hypothetical protein